MRQTFVGRVEERIPTVDLATGIITNNTPGFYVFSAPWETTSTLMENINQQQSYDLDVPTSYKGPNHVYVISIPPSGTPRLITYDSNLTPQSTYPVSPGSGWHG